MYEAEAIYAMAGRKGRAGRTGLAGNRIVCAQDMAISGSTRTRAGSIHTTRSPATQAMIGESAIAPPIEMAVFHACGRLCACSGMNAVVIEVMTCIDELKEACGLTGHGHVTRKSVSATTCEFPGMDR